jgi:arginyl-tRNA synthetase
MDFKEELTKLLKKELKKEITLEVPPDQKLGDFAFPCFSLVKEFKKNPAAIAQELAQKIKAPFIDHIEVQGAYLNFFLNKEQLAKDILTKILAEKETYGSSLQGKGKTVAIDMSSPNIAKPFGIGHLRSTLIGNSIHHLLTFQGYKVIRINHVGDWGTQFGKLIFACEKWSTKKLQNLQHLQDVQELYVKFHKEAEKHPEYEEEARKWFKRLEDGDAKARAYWKHFKDISLVEFKKIYDILDVHFEDWSGESFYNDQLDATIEFLNKKKLTEISDGALIINLEKYDMPPALLRKSDGATLYLTRDIAALLYRQKKYQFDAMIYEVGAEQKLHFQQLFKIIELLGYTWHRDCVHIDHGLYLGADGKKFSTRKGKTIFMADLIEEAINLAKKTIEQKNPKLKQKENVAKMVGIGAIIFGDLCNDRTRDILFDLNKFTSFDGETGPYLQYTHARLCSILRKKSVTKKDAVNFNNYDAQEQSLVTRLSYFPTTIADACRQYKPHILARYLLDLAQEVNSFYASHPVLQEDKIVETARLALVAAVQRVLATGLNLLGIKAPEEM